MDKKTKIRFQIGDSVWAKVKYCPYWPGKIITAPENKKEKPNHDWVLFFGTYNYAQVHRKKIFSYRKYSDRFKPKKMYTSLKHAMHGVEVYEREMLLPHLPEGTVVNDIRIPTLRLTRLKEKELDPGFTKNS